MTPTGDSPHKPDAPAGRAHETIELGGDTEPASSTETESSQAFVGAFAERRFSPYTPEGHVESVGLFARGLGARRIKIVGALLAGALATIGAIGIANTLF